MRKPPFVATGILISTMSAASMADNPTDFTVKNETTTFKLSEARGRYVALHFLLRTECPYCQEHLRSYIKRAPELAGVLHVFLKPDTEADYQSWMNATKLATSDQVMVFHDADAQLADDYGIPEDLQFHGQTMHRPALVLLDHKGAEVFRYIGKDNTDRAPFEMLAAEVTQRWSDPHLKEFNLQSGQPAIQGYDPVSYFEGGQPQKGIDTFPSQYRGQTFRFAKALNRARFAANPEMYLPQYGGWCATAMAEGKKVEIDPTNFKVTNGRLFLFYKSFFADALKDWNKKEAELTRQADQHWAKIAPKNE